jgi:hypothetical protein
MNSIIPRLPYPYPAIIYKIGHHNKSTYLTIRCFQCGKPIPIRTDTLISSTWYGYSCNCGHVTDFKTYKENKKETTNK